MKNLALDKQATYPEQVEKSNPLIFITIPILKHFGLLAN